MTDQISHFFSDAGCTGTPRSRADQRRVDAAMGAAASPAVDPLHG